MDGVCLTQLALLGGQKVYLHLKVLNFIYCGPPGGRIHVGEGLRKENIVGGLDVYVFGGVTSGFHVPWLFIHEGEEPVLIVDVLTLDHVVTELSEVTLIFEEEAKGQRSIYL